MPRLFSILLYALSSAIGLAAFFSPLIVARTAEEVSADAPLLTALLVILCLAAIFVEAQGRGSDAKQTATLGVLVALTAVLRFLETAVPGPGGFSPIFAPIILTGYVFGARFGFLMGALTLLASALITGGVGPWLPYQMFGAGWVGLGAGLLPHWRERRALWLLVGFGFFVGLAYGALLNLTIWPFLAGPLGPDGSDAGSLLGRYAAFYLTTSLVWDLFGAAGNAVLLLAFGLPALRALTRFQNRLAFRLLDPG